MSEKQEKVASWAGAERVKKTGSRAHGIHWMCVLLV